MEVAPIILINAVGLTRDCSALRPPWATGSQQGGRVPSKKLYQQ